jgi:hypothetical protein
MPQDELRRREESLRERERKAEGDVSQARQQEQRALEALAAKVTRNRQRAQCKLLSELTRPECRSRSSLLLAMNGGSNAIASPRRLLPWSESLRSAPSASQSASASFKPRMSRGSIVVAFSPRPSLGLAL